MHIGVATVFTCTKIDKFMGTSEKHIEAVGADANVICDIYGNLRGSDKVRVARLVCDWDYSVPV